MNAPDLYNLYSPSLVGVLALASLLLLGFLGFTVKSAIGGRPRTERVMRQGGSILLNQYLMEYMLWLFRPITRACVRLNLHPDVLSWTSLALQLFAAAAITAGYFGLAAWLLLVGAMCDSLDGAVARELGLSSDSGELLDASVDRWSEMALFFAYAWYYRDMPVGFALAALSCIGAVMVSYARAKGEAMGIDQKAGLMQRHERATYLVAAMILSAIAVQFWEPERAHPRHYIVLGALALIALLSNITAIQRFALIRLELRRKGR